MRPMDLGERMSAVFIVVLLATAGPTGAQKANSQATSTVDQTDPRPQALIQFLSPRGQSKCCQVHLLLPRSCMAFRPDGHFD